MKADTREKGKLVREQYIVKALGKFQKIFQARIDAKTSYTERLTHRLKLTIDDERFNFYETIGTDIEKIGLIYSKDDRSDVINEEFYNILKITQIDHNNYIMELGDMIRLKR